MNIQANQYNNTKAKRIIEILNTKKLSASVVLDEYEQKYGSWSYKKSKRTANTRISRVRAISVFMRNAPNIEREKTSKAIHTYVYWNKEVTI